jgi:hypothetical protein
MNWLKGHFYLQFVQIAIGIVVAYLVWQNGRRQIDKLDKKLDLLINWQMTHRDRDPPVTYTGGFNMMQGRDLVDNAEDSFT